MRSLKDDCFQTSNVPCYCIEFHFDGLRRGFHASQLIEYSLAPNPEADKDEDRREPAPPEKLALAFSTADVVVLGWRLGRLADSLSENKLAAIGVLSKRYADFDRDKPLVASITITPIGKD